MSRSHRSGADGVVAHNQNLNTHSEILSRTRPPRPLDQRWLRDIFFISRPPLLSRPLEEGILTSVPLLRPLSPHVWFPPPQYESAVQNARISRPFAYRVKTRE